jgi:beta-phosphoglucomutase-like phosphatase (HAD superfamily)
MEPYKAILFDFDGVLVDSEPVHYRCWRKVLLPFGFDLQWEVYHQHFIGTSDRKMVDAIVELSPVPLLPEEIYAQYPAKAAAVSRRDGARGSAVAWSGGTVRRTARFQDRRGDLQPAVRG